MLDVWLFKLEWGKEKGKRSLERQIKGGRIKRGAGRVKNKVVRTGGRRTRRGKRGLLKHEMQNKFLCMQTVKCYVNEKRRGG